MGVLYTALIGFGQFFCLLSRVLFIYLHTRGAFGVVSALVHWKTIFLICYLLDYQQVQENSNVSIILLGDKKEPTKWKTNLVQQILLPNTIFPVTFTSRTIFTGGKKKDVLLVYGCQPKPIHKYKFIHLRIYILMDWMNWTNCGAIAQSCHVQYWVVALFLSASKNSCMISVTFHL